jgi:uncharacterized repeat protein (TIGR01451 family)
VARVCSNRKDTIVKRSRRAPSASPRFWVATAGAIALLTLGTAAPAQAATQVVENPSNGVRMCTLDAADSYGQWFVSPTPGNGQLTDVGFVVGNSAAEYSAVLTVSEGIGNAGDVMTTQDVIVPVTQTEEELVSFDLETPVPVTPGGTYSVQLQMADPCPFGIFGGEPYGEGTALRNGNQVSGDLAFRLEFETPDGTPPSIGGQPSAGTVGAAYSYAFAIGGTPPPDVSADSAQLPPGLSLSSTGVLSGTPTTAGSYTFTVAASNPSGIVGITVTMQVNPATKPKADVALSLSAPASAAKGGTFVVTANVVNKGPSTAASVTTDLVLPPGVRFVSASAPVSRVGSIVSWSVQNLANGQSQQLKVTVTATKSGSQLFAGGSLRLGTPDPKLLNNVAAAVTKVK